MEKPVERLMTRIDQGMRVRLGPVPMALAEIHALTHPAMCARHGLVSSLLG